MNNKCAVVVMAFDSYNDVWDGFFKCKEKYWKDCEFPTYMITCETTDVPSGVNRVITTSKNVEWTERLHMALEEIQEQYIILLLEDLYIDAIVDNKKILECINIMDNDTIGHLRLNPDIKYQIDYSKNDLYGEYLPGHAYRISTHPAMWQKSYLQKLTEKSIDAWSFEYEMSYESDKYEEKSITTKEKVISFTNTIWRQKWTREGVMLCKREKIVIDYSRRGKHSFWSKVKTDIGALIYHIVGADLVTKIKMKTR